MEKTLRKQTEDTTLEVKNKGGKKTRVGKTTVRSTGATRVPAPGKAGKKTQRNTTRKR
jgi:hypothetical protein